jgi:hypothetical protein
MRLIGAVSTAILMFLVLKILPNLIAESKKKRASTSKNEQGK